jgi:hypothetical protein
MSDLLRSYRALPTGQRAVVVGVGLIVAIVLLVNLPHIMGTAIAVGLTLVVLAFCAAALAGLVALVYLLVRAIGSRP